MKKILYLTLIVVMCFCMIGCTNNNAFTIGENEYTKEDVEKVKTILVNTSNYIDKDYLENLKKSEGDNYDKALNDLVISYMIDNEIVYEEAQKKDYKIEDNQVENKYNDIEQLLDLNKDYKKVLDDAGVDEDYLKEMIKKDLLVSKYREEQEKDIVIKDKEIEEYYNNHKDDFKEENVKASHILFTTLDDEHKSLSEDKIKDKKQQADDILAKIKAGGDFEKLAKENSDDQNSGKNGGDLGYFNKTDKNTEFTEKVFSLKTGDISDVFETPYGYEIVKITDKKEVQKTLEESKDEVKKILLTNKYLEKIKTLRDKSDVKRYI